MKKFLKYSGLAALVIISAVALTFIIWANSIYKADPEKLQLTSDEAKNNFHITEKTDYWEIIPNDPGVEPAKYQDAGLIFYPGAKVEPQAYFYKLSELSNGQSGKIRVFITKPTLNLAVFNISQADKVIADHPEVKKWIIGGHSLGGAMSCEYAKNQTAKVSELWLLASYCGSDISNLNIKVISIHGSLDGVLSPQKLSDSRRNLPADALDFEIQGMNHAQVGNYGAQSGDNEPSKTDQEIHQEMEKIFKKLVSE